MSGVPVDDRGLTLGVGLFETVLAIDGRLAQWDAHMRRLERSCPALALPAPDRTACLAAANEALEKAGLKSSRAAVRLTWTGGSGARGLAAPALAAPRLLVSAAPSPAPPASLALRTSAIRRNASSPASRLKTLSYLDNVIARAEATAAGADEALMLNQMDAVACAAAANLFWLEGRTLCTPALSCGVLDGIIRSAALSSAARLGMEIAEVEAPLQRLLAADSAFVTNSLQGPVAISKIDGVEFHQSSPHLENLSRRLRLATHEITPSD